jgi:hypothetical protein
MAKDAEVASLFQLYQCRATDLLRSHRGQVAGAVIEADCRLVERDAGGIEMIISAEGKELPLLWIKQGLTNAIASTQSGDDTDLVNPLATLLRQGVERLGNNLRGQAGHAQENMS